MVSFSLPLTLEHFIRNIVAHQRATLKWPWRSLRSLSALVWPHRLLYTKINSVASDKSDICYIS